MDWNKVSAASNMSYFDVMHHLKVKEILWAFQNESGAHVWGGVVKVKDDIVRIRASLGSKHSIDFPSPLDFIWQPFYIWSTVNESYPNNVDNTL